MRVFKEDIEVELAQDEQLTLHHTVPEIPELLVTLQWSTATVEEPIRRTERWGQIDI